MYNIRWLTDNKVCSCFYVVLLGNFICRMHLQTCITSHHITSQHITSHHTTSHHITSHHITSHHITSYIVVYRYFGTTCRYYFQGSNSVTSQKYGDLITPWRKSEIMLRNRESKKYSTPLPLPQLAPYRVTDLSWAWLSVYVVVCSQCQLEEEIGEKCGLKKCTNQGAGWQASSKFQTGHHCWIKVIHSAWWCEVGRRQIGTLRVK
jgi:hypothetical protein